MITKCENCKRKLKKHEAKLYTDKNHNTVILCPECIELFKNSK